MIAHARHVHAYGAHSFLVGSAAGRFAELTTLGRLELLVWEGQPVSIKLADVVHALHRLPRPSGTPTDAPAASDHLEPEPMPDLPTTASPATAGQRD